MKKIIRGAIFVLRLLAGTVFADPSRFNWLKQDDGTYWRTCVGDDGRQYCEQAVDFKTITRVSCNGKK